MNICTLSSAFMIHVSLLRLVTRRANSLRPEREQCIIRVHAHAYEKTQASGTCLGLILH